MSLWSRRKFFLTSLAGSAAAGVTNLFARTAPAAAESASPAASPAQGKRPVIISSANGVNALGRGMDILKKGGDTLDAVIAAVTVVEDDPNDDSVGYGGLPNEEGEVELDASCMHGPTHRAGSVASVRRIKNVARLAKTVMERTNHVMIVGDGARRFAVAEGFEEMNLLTEHSRKIWLAWKIPGRVGDSPIIGAGCCVDNEVGAAGSTGKGEENIKISGGHTIIEMMRKGMSPTDACLEAMARIARNYNNDKKKLATFHIFFYALNKDGAHGAASLWQNAYDKGHRATYAAHDGTESRLLDCKPYFDEIAVSD